MYELVSRQFHCLFDFHFDTIILRNGRNLSIPEIPYLTVPVEHPQLVVALHICVARTPPVILFEFEKQAC